jgi:hypothetical protein
MTDPTITPALLDSIARLVDYSYADEQRDFEEMERMGEVSEGDENHIFTHIKRLADWLDEGRER